MPISNDPDPGPGNTLSELLRLQTEFQARLAEETVAYLRRLQGAGQADRGRIVMPDGGDLIEASGVPGGEIELRAELENRQRVHSMVTPLLGPLVSVDGVTWTPAAIAQPPSLLVAPGEQATAALSFPIPAELPSGTYRGALFLQGFRADVVPVAVSVSASSSNERSAGH